MLKAQANRQVTDVSVRAETTQHRRESDEQMQYDHDVISER